jgi:hypothetical protein
VVAGVLSRSEGVHVDLVIDEADQRQRDLGL